MKKQTKVLLAAALFTLGASFSSMAALKNGTWQLNEEGWQYADKDGDYVEGEWCVSYGTEYWINDEGVLGASEWVTDDEHTYYVQSDGSKTISAWKYIFAEDDEDAEEESWFYFDAKGRMVKDTKKTIGDYTYYFDAEGKMLTGWVEYAKDGDGKYYAVPAVAGSDPSKVMFANEDGKVIKTSWLEEFPYGSDEDEVYAGEDEVYYYAGSNGYLYNTKKDVDGLTYFFNKANGQMLDGWIEKVNVGTVEKPSYIYTAADAIEAGKTIYWANEIGYASKNEWEELERPEEDDEVFWYHFNKLGEVFIAKKEDAKIAAATFEDGSLYSVTTDSDAVAVQVEDFDGVDYHFNAKGEMIDGLVYINDVLHYMEDGALQTGKVTLTDDYENDYTFYFAEKTDAEEGYKKYAAVTGNYGGYLYDNGQLVTTEDEYAKATVTIKGVPHMFIIDENGKIQKSTNKEYFTKGETFTFSKKDGVTEYSATVAE